MNENLKNIVDEYIMSHVFEIGSETETRWMKILADKRLVNFKDYYESRPELEFKTKKAQRQFETYFKETFVEKMLEYQKLLKSAKTVEEKDAILQYGLNYKK